LYFVSVYCCFNNFVDHGGCRGNTAQALAQWRHPVALSEALDVLYQAMRPVLYRRIRMAIEIASDSPAFFVVVDLFLPITIALNYNRVRLLFL
jgi:hypothetical protein